MQKKKILVVNYNMIVGGSTTSLLNFLSLVDKEKYEIDVLLYRNEGALLNYLPRTVNLLPQACLYNEKNKHKKIMKALLNGYLFRAKILNILSKRKGLSTQLMSECQAKEYSRQLDKQYDVAIGYMEGWADRYVAYNAKAKRKYGWLHSTFEKIAPVPTLELSWMKEMDRIVCVAEACRVDMIQHLPAVAEKSITIENMIDPSFIRKRAHDVDLSDEIYVSFASHRGTKIASVCRLSIETKGIDRIINSVSKLKEKGYQFKWIIVGDGDDKEKISKSIIEKKLESHLVLAGSRLNPYPIMSKADFICMPSRWEGKPMTVLESRALGIPCLVTKYLSAEEQIENGVTGWIVDNSDEAILPVIEELLLNREQIDCMKENLANKPFYYSEYIKNVEQVLFE